MRIRCRNETVLGLCLALSAGASVAAPVDPLVGDYSAAPPAWREYLLEARKVDGIEDPMARCLAFPRLPETHWAPGLIEAHCAYAFSLKLTLADIRARVESGDAAGLDATFKELLDRHFLKEGFSEEIHAAIDLFSSEYEPGQLSKKWLELAPQSPYALAARAHYYQEMGWQARGGKYVSETPDENLGRMKELHAKAVDLYVGAIKAEPRLLPAYAGLVNLDRRSGPGDAERAFKAALKIDPGCKDLMSERMSKLRPRWGGSYPLMGELEEVLAARTAERPLLSLPRIAPYLDIADVLDTAKEYAKAQAVLQPLVQYSSSPQLYEDLAVAMAPQKEGVDRWRELAYLVEASRFRPGRAYVARTRGRLQMLLANDAQMAHRSLGHAVAADPEDAYAHYLYAASLSRLGRLDEAATEYEAAMKDKDNRRDALTEAIGVAMRAKRQPVAVGYADTLTREYPDYARGWWLKARVHTPGPIPPIQAALEQFLAHADPTDPAYSSDVMDARRALEQMRALKQGAPAGPPKAAPPSAPGNGR